MKTIALTLGSVLVLIGFATGSADAIRLTRVNAKSLCITRADIGRQYVVSGSFTKHSQSNQSLYSHSMIKEFSRAFQTKSSSNPFTNITSEGAVFKRIKGASWNLSYIPKHAAASHSTIKFSPTTVPGYGDQSMGWSLSETAGKTKYTGLLIAMRKGHFDGALVMLGLESKFRTKDAYRLAKRQLKYLSNVK